jgi:L-seryl-tRNA(Ser) seleniumtransferase
VKAEVFVPEVANHVPHVRISSEQGNKAWAERIVDAMRDGEPSIAIRSEGPALVIGIWMMRQGEDKIVAKRLRQVLEKPTT